jgi:hypothetical protein
MFTFRRSLVACGIAASILSPARAQNITTPPGRPGYVNAAAVNATRIDPHTPASSFVFQIPPTGADSTSVFMNPTLGRTGNSNAGGNIRFPANGGTVLGLREASTFGGAFAAQAGPNVGQVYKYTILGNPPLAGGTTNIATNIDEISWTLLNDNGTVFKTLPFAPFEALTLGSPNFQTARYSSAGSPVQFADAVQRAEFYSSIQSTPGWHTNLAPTVVNRVNITVPYWVNVLFPNGTVVRARSFFTGTASDGTTFVLMLDLLFEFLFDNEVVNEIELGNFSTDGVNMTAFPNTYLFSLNMSNPQSPGDCCVLGFHTYFYDNAVPQDRWLTIYESWISPGIFGGGFQDVTALSHEISETFNDPYIDNVTPNWQFPGQPHGSTVCQNDLETGDPIEVLSNATFPVTLGGFTYHPQNEALIPWFGMGSSNAIGGAYSYPNTTVLPHAALPCGS